MFITILLMLNLPIANAQVYNSKVQRVVDNDTVRLSQPILGSKSVRLLSIDTPEKNFQGRNQGPHAYAATNYLSQLLPAGTTIQLELVVEPKDQFGRLLAHIYKSNLDINKEMVRKDHAVTYFIYPNLRHFGEYQNALVQAKNQEQDIWNPNSPLVKLPFEFRTKIPNGVPTKWVVDSLTKEVVQPNE